MQFLAEREALLSVLSEVLPEQFFALEVLFTFDALFVLVVFVFFVFITIIFAEVYHLSSYLLCVYFVPRVADYSARLLLSFRKNIIIR